MKQFHGESLFQNNFSLKFISSISVFIILSGIPAVLIPEIDKFSHIELYISRFIFFKKLYEYLT